MALEVAEGAVVGHHLEAVAQRLQPAAGAVPAVAALAHQLDEHLRALVGGQRVHGALAPPPRTRRPPRTAAPPAGRPRSPRPRAAAPTARVSSVPRACGRGPAARPSARRPSRALLEVGDPLAAALGALHAREEAGHHRLELGEDHPAIVARLGQRRGQTAQDQLLVGLPRGEHAHVRERGRGQQSAHEVERLGIDRARVGGLRLAVGAREALGGPRAHAREAVASRRRTGSPSRPRTRGPARGRASSGSALVPSIGAS